MSMDLAPAEIAPEVLDAWLRAEGELALVDAREEVPFSRRHLLQARCLPWTRMELLVPDRIPRRSTPIVLCADGPHNRRAASRLADMGYTNVKSLAGGIDAWSKAGFPVVSGVNVPSKAFGEFVEREYGTPSIGPDELQALLDQGADIRVFDARPLDDYRVQTIPTSASCPGAELAFRVPVALAGPDTLVVVNCAGRTRSILGAQSLINAGLPNRVVALRNGTMGWALAGLTVESGANRLLGAPPPPSAERSREAARRFADAAGVRDLDPGRFERWLDECEERTLYLVDVRTSEEADLDPLPGLVCAPGGQLVQATDLYLGTLRARVVLFDPEWTRALMTGAWLRAMGWDEVYVAPPDQVRELARKAGLRRQPPVFPQKDGLDVAGARTMASSAGVTVLDLSKSPQYRAGHLPGAVYATRGRFEAVLDEFGASSGFLLTCEDGRLSGLAASELRALTTRPVAHLAGGVRAWVAAGQPVEREPVRWSTPPEDVWLRPYEREREVTSAMREYLSWEVDLLDAVARDGSLGFHVFHPMR